MAELVWSNSYVAPASIDWVLSMEVTVALLASTIVVVTLQLAAAAFSFFTSVLTLTVAEVAETVGVVTKVPYHVTWSGSVTTR